MKRYSLVDYSKTRITNSDSKHQNRAAVKKTVTKQKAEVDLESVIRGAYDKVSSSPEALDKVIAEMRADGINIETLVATERERILGSLSRAYSESKYSGVQGDNRGIISYLEAVETAAKDQNYIKRLIAAEYLAKKQLASSDHSASTAIESRSADVSAAADISYTEQTSNAVDKTSVDNSAENGIIDNTKKIASGKFNRPIQDHHFATNKNKKYTPQIYDIISKYGLDLNDDWNIEPMPHQGRHPNEYHEWVIEQMNQIDNKARGNKDEFLRMFENTKQTIRDEPDMLRKKWWRNRHEILQSDV